MSGACYIPFAELAEVLGEIAAVRLVAAIGGTRLYVPTAFRPDSPVVRAIGAGAAAALSRHYAGTGRGGMWIEVPRGPTGARADLRRRLDELAARPDLSERQIARELRMTGRGVRKARARLRRVPDDDEQGRLF